MARPSSATSRASAGSPSTRAAISAATQNDWLRRCEERYDVGWDVLRERNVEHAAASAPRALDAPGRLARKPP